MIQGFKILCSLGLKFQSQIPSRPLSSMSKKLIKQRQNEIFVKEKENQRNNLGRIEKINVKYMSPTEEVHLVMNKNISTPHDCALHISEGVSKVSAIALVDNVLWDMHKPLYSDCNLRLINLRNPERMSVNAAFWRTCSFILGAVIESAFKDDIQLHLHSFTWPNIKSGSFVYDAYIDLQDWKPTEAELKSLSSEFVKLIRQELPVEQLTVSESCALEIFRYNPFKVKQVPDIAEKNDNLVTLFRVGDHIDMSKGPMIGNTGNIGRCTVSSVHRVSCDDSEEMLYRFQGVAIPSGIMINHFAYKILEDRAKKLNTTTWIPIKYTDEFEQNNVALSAHN